MTRKSHHFTGTDASVKSSIVGIAVDLDMHCNVVKDEELIQLLNEMIKNNAPADVLREPNDMLSVLEVAKGFLSEQVLSLGLPYKLPTVEPLTAFYKV
ncbi:hypothetical protein NB520_13110 [Vibrio antiquarius]|uniref:hypothetical protein n=1 Tax=Vibrio antiquarius (strain Ex25) TaxID=150340 RepID=UPI00265AA02E|nr:hypothetical protein [Vibrio antiquarius]MCR9629667.1 hypothetical protein [Vibrio antiquarius]MCR9632456.1 hypothetical protein [Vibrio antiquarius]